MFTGLIQDIGQIESINGGIISVKTSLDVSDVKIGDSVALNGACQTVIKKSGNALTFEAMNETFNRTNFSSLKKGDFVNLERAMTLNDRLDGHMVSGHVDCTAKLLGVLDDGVAKIFKFKCDTDLIIEKGSISVNGISLTVKSVDDACFEVSVLPYTLNNTNLKYLTKNSVVNIEYDMVGKYIKKFTKKESKITKEFLLECGF